MAAQLDLTSGSGSSAVTETAISQSGINDPKVGLPQHGAVLLRACSPRLDSPVHWNVKAHADAT